MHGGRDSPAQKETESRLPSGAHTGSSAGSGVTFIFFVPSGLIVKTKCLSMSGSNSAKAIRPFVGLGTVAWAAPVAASTPTKAVAMAANAIRDLPLEDGG